MENNSDAIDSILKKLLLTIPEMRAAAIFSAKGFPIVSSFSQNIDDKLISPMLTTIHAIGEGLISECSIGLLKQVIIKGKKGNIILNKFGPKQVLCMIAEPNANLKLFQFQQTKNKFSKILSMIKKENTHSLIFERQYLFEIFDKKDVQINNIDGLPALKKDIEIELNEKKDKSRI